MKFRANCLLGATILAISSATCLSISGCHDQRDDYDHHDHSMHPDMDHHDDSGHGDMDHGDQGDRH